MAKGAGETTIARSPLLYLSRGVIDTAMFGRTESDQKEKKNVQLVVEDEQALYTTFSPEDEFTDSVKSYIRSKITGRDFNGYAGLTVISRKAINENRFRLAMKNWVRDENDKFKRDRKDTIRMLIGLLLFGSALVLFNISLQQKYEVARYSLVPIMGSLSLSRATGLLIIDLPILSSKIKLLNAIEKGSMVTFEQRPERKERT